MSRFREPQDPDFVAMNASIGFDRRLWRQDIEQSRAHANMLAAQGIVAATERDALLAGWSASPPSSRAVTSSSRLRTKTSTWRSSAT